MQLRNSRVLVTGASRGLGRNIAQAMARRGADVALVARNAEQLEELAKELGGKAYPADLMDPAAVEELIGRVEADGPVDVIVNNAGVDRVGRFYEASSQDVRDLLQVNLIAPMELCRQAMPLMIKRGRGHIVNVSSMGAISTGPGVTLYGASKAGLSHFTAGIRSELRGKPVNTTLVQMIDHIRSFGPARRTIERSLKFRMIPQEPLDADMVAEAIADAVEKEKKHVILPKRIAAMAYLTETPRRVSELMLTGIDQDSD
jgi:short-subunit dehydrogenase